MAYKDINPNTAVLPELVLLLEHAQHGTLTNEQRERIYKAFAVVNAVIPVGGHTTLINTTNITNHAPHDILRISGGKLSQYSYSESGLRQALADASSGGAVQIYSGTISIAAAFTVPDNVTITAVAKNTVTLTASNLPSTMINLGNGSILDGINITYTANDTDFNALVQNPTSGEAYLRNCKFTITQSSTGTTSVVRMQTKTGDLVALNCELISTSSGNAYIVHKESTTADGWLRMYFGYLYASTAAANY